MGLIVDLFGSYPGPENTEAIKQMPPPFKLNSQSSFLELVNDHALFLPSTHQHRTPPNELLSRQLKWNCSLQYQKDFNNIKKTLSLNKLFTHSNQNLKVVIVSNASNYRLVVIPHIFPVDSQKTIGHASRTPYYFEKNHSQIEKGTLAIIFAVKKFHTMIYGPNFTFLTNHKHLSIFSSKKGISMYTTNLCKR